MCVCLCVCVCARARAMGAAAGRCAWRTTYICPGSRAASPDNSFGNSFTFTETNVLGTHVMLEAAKLHGVRARRRRACMRGV